MREREKSELRSLIEAAGGGDLDAFTSLVVRFQDAVFANAYARLRDFGHAEDAAQEVFVDAYRHLADLREPAAFTAWLRAIVAKHCDRVLRRRKLEHVSLSEEIGAASDDPVEALDRVRARDRVRDAVDSLPAGERLVVLHTYLAEQTAAEASAFLELPLTTVKKRLHSARRRLARQLGDLLQETFRERRPSHSPTFSARIELFLALRAGDAARVERLLDAQPGLLDAEEDWDVDDSLAEVLPFPFRATPLIRAAEQGDRDMVARLLARGADVNRRCGCFTKETALFAATVTSRPDVAADLLAAGAEIEAATAGGIRPLHVAAMRGDSRLLELLLGKGADVHARDGQGRSAGDWARERGWNELARVLCDTDGAAIAASAPPAPLLQRPGQPRAAELFGRVLDPAGRCTDPGPAALGRRPEAACPPPASAERAGRDAIWETGIKAIDLLAPLPLGGRVVVEGGRRRSGVMILLLELVRRVGRAVVVGWERHGYERVDTVTALRETATQDHAIVVYASRDVEVVDRLRAWETASRLSRELAGSGEHLLVLALEPDAELAGLPGPDEGRAAPITLLVAPPPGEAAPHHAGTHLDARLSLSARLAAARLFPALDARESESSLLLPEVVGERHCRLARQARDLLARHEGAEPRSAAAGDADDVGETTATARRLRAYLTQPFFCSEPFSGRSGVSVPRAQMLDDVEAILGGRWDHLAPEEVLYAPAGFAPAALQT